MARERIDAKRAALSLGLLSALSHLVWVAVVAAGFGQALADWVKGLHFVARTETIAPFDATTAIVGIVSAFAAGAIVGGVFAWIWNSLGR